MSTEKKWISPKLNSETCSQLPTVKGKSRLFGHLIQKLWYLLKEAKSATSRYEFLVITDTSQKWIEMNREKGNDCKQVHQEYSSQECSKRSAEQVQAHALFFFGGLGGRV